MGKVLNYGLKTKRLCQRKLKLEGTGSERGENLGSEETEIILMKNSSDKLSLITSAFPI